MLFVARHLKIADAVMVVVLVLAGVHSVLTVIDATALDAEVAASLVAIDAPTVGAELDAYGSSAAAVTDATLAASNERARLAKMQAMDAVNPFGTPVAPVVADDPSRPAVGAPPSDEEIEAALAAGPDAATGDGSQGGARARGASSRGGCNTEGAGLRLAGVIFSEDESSRMATLRVAKSGEALTAHAGARLFARDLAQPVSVRRIERDRVQLQTSAGPLCLLLDNGTPASVATRR